MGTAFSITPGERYVEFPKRTRTGGAGRTRADNPFDAVVQESYDQRDHDGFGVAIPVKVEPATEEAMRAARNRAHAAAEWLGVGLDIQPYGTDAIVVRAREKRAKAPNGTRAS